MAYQKQQYLVPVPLAEESCAWMAACYWKTNFFVVHMTYISSFNWLLALYKASSEGINQQSRRIRPMGCYLQQIKQNITTNENKIQQLYMTFIYRKKALKSITISEQH